MSKRILIVRILTILLIWVTNTPLASAQATPEGWLGGKQAPYFPQPLSPASTTTFLEPAAQSPSTQALPGSAPASPQANSGAAQGAASDNSPTSGWTLPRNEFQVQGLASMSGGKFGDTKYKRYGFCKG